MITRARSKLAITKRKALYATNHPISQPELNPTIYNQVSKEHHRRQAMAMELTALVQNNTWTLILAADAQNNIGCK
jgi:hypothetical protein